MNSISIRHFDDRLPPLFINPEVVHEKRTEQNNSVLTRLLDVYAPLVTRSITLRPNASWFNDSHRESKRIERKYERRWRKSGLEVDKIAFYNQCRASISDLEKLKLTIIARKYLSVITKHCFVW